MSVPPMHAPSSIQPDAKIYVDASGGRVILTYLAEYTYDESTTQWTQSELRYPRWVPADQPACPWGALLPDMLAPFPYRYGLVLYEKNDSSWQLCKETTNW